MFKKVEDMEVEIRERMRGGNGNIKIMHVLKKDEFTSKVRLCAKITIDKDCSIGEHAHVGEDEIYYILSGEAIVKDGDEEIKVKAGDVVLTGNGKSHSIKNSAEEPLEMLATIILY